MTSEIAVMNQRAVALAADSAVTLIDGGTVVVRNDTRKLFNLVEGRPVGVMFFGVADLMGHPWEILINQYGAHSHGAAQPRIRDYAESFCAMLDEQKEFFPAERQKDEYKRLLASVFRYVFRLAQYYRETGEGGEALSDTQILETAIARVWTDYQVREDGSPRHDLPCFPQGFATKVQQEHGATINELIVYGFGSFGLSADATAKLKDIGTFCVVKDLFLEDVTGLVFAGFGSQENYPTVVTYFASAIVGGILKRAEASVDTIGGDIRSKIRVFADSEVTNAFIRGIDFNLERRVYGAMQLLLHGLVDQIVGNLPNASQREEVRRHALSDLIPQYFDAFRGMIGEYQQQAFINPVLRVLEIASPRELAETARELVSLNVFKKKITAQKQTVGGAIDVAVISREGGFQWHNRQDGLG